MRLFLSYSTQDYELANRLRLAMKQCRPDFDIYFAPKHNNLGTYWIERLGNELMATDAVILLIGRDVGKWQKLEYDEALRLNRTSGGYPLIAPILLTELAPELPFLNQFHQLSYNTHTFSDLVNLIIQALDAAKIDDKLPAWRQINPYRGLLAMDTQDAAFFFGREKLSAHILTRIEQHPEKIHALIGNSGVGKSSIAMAGILAALKSQLWPGDWNQQWPEALRQSHRWPVCLLKPGETPVKALTQACVALWLDSPADIEQEALKWRRLLLDESLLSSLVGATLEQVAIRNDNERPDCLVLYIDQLEELYSSAEHKEALRFSELLAAAVIKPDLIIITSLRSDYYGSLQQDSALFKATERLDVPPLDQADIARIIRLPAERLKVQFENPELIDLMAEATAREPGAMPMLSDVLADTWRSMAELSGGEAVLRFPASAINVSRTLAEKVEHFFIEHTTQKAVLKQLFTLKLVHLTKEGEALRRRLQRNDCSADEWTVIEAMAAPEWRLLTTGNEAGEAIAEVAHEALLRHWPRLKEWLNESREFLLWKGQFEVDLLSWEQAGETNRSRALLTGLKLDKAQYWQALRRSDLLPEQKKFIADSVRAATKSERHRVWAQRAILLLMVLSVCVAILAWSQRNSAIDAQEDAVISKRHADQQRKLAVARRLAMAAEKVFDENIGETTLAGLLSIKSLQTMPTKEGKQMLRRVLALTPDNIQRIDTPWPRSKMQHSSDGKLTVFSRLRSQGGSWKPASGAVALMDTQSSRATIHYSLQGSSQPVISADGHWLAIAGYGRRLQIISLQTTQTLIDVHQDDMIDVVFSHDSQTLYVARTDGVIEVRKKPHWKILTTLNYPVKKNRPYKVKLEVNPNDSQLLLRARGQNPFLINVNSAKLIELKGQPKSIGKGGLFSSSGDLIITYGWRGGIMVWDAQSGELMHQSIEDDEFVILAVTTLPGSERIVVSTKTGGMRVVDAKTGVTQHQLAQDFPAHVLAVSASGQYLVAATNTRDKGLVALWDLVKGHKILDIPHDDKVWTLKFGNHDQTLITGSDDGALAIFNRQNGEKLQRFTFDNAITAIAHHPESGALALRIHQDDHQQAWSDVMIIDRQTGKKVSQFEHNGGFRKIAFSLDSRTLVTLAGFDGDVKLWDTQTGTLKANPEIRADTIFFSSNGQRLIASYLYDEAVIINIADGKKQAVIGEPGGVSLVKFAPDQRTVTTFGKDRSFRGWDVISRKQLWHRASGLVDKYIQMSADGRRYADYSEDHKKVIIGEARTGSVIAKIPAGEHGKVLFSQTGHQLLITRSHLGKRSVSGGKYSEFELWDVDTGKRLIMQKYEHENVVTQMLSGNRFVIIASPGSANDPEGVIDVFDADQGSKLWSVPSNSSLIKVIAPKQRKDIVVIGTGLARQIRDLASGHLITEVGGGGLQNAEVTLEGKLILLANLKTLSSFDQEIQIRTIDNGELLKTIPVAANIQGLAISKDGRFLFAAITNDYTPGVRIWRTTDWSEFGFIKMDASPLSLTPLLDTDLLGVQDRSEIFRVWRVSTGTEEYRFSHTFTANGMQAASAASRVLTWRGASLRLWDMEAGSELAHHISQGKVVEAAIAPDGRTIVYLTDHKRAAKLEGDYSAVVIWEPGSGTKPVVLPMANPRDVKFDPSGRWFIVQHGEKSLQVINITTLQTIASFKSLAQASISDFTFSEDGELLIVQEKKGVKLGLRVFSIVKNQEIARIDGSAFKGAEFESQELLTRDTQGQWHSWSADAARSDKLLRQSAQSPYFSITPILETNQLIIYSEHDISLVDFVNHSEIVIFPELKKEHYIKATTFNKASNHVATSILDDSDNSAHHVLLKDLQGHELARLKTESVIENIKFVDHGNALMMVDSVRVGGATVSQLRLWFWRAGELKVLSQGTLINAILVNPEGTQFVSAEGETKAGFAQLKIWDAITGKMLIKSLPLSGDVQNMAYSSDSHLLAVKLSRKFLVYQTSDWSVLKEIDIKREAATEYFLSGKVAFGVDNQLIVKGVTGSIKIDSLNNGNSSFQLRDGGRSARLNYGFTLSPNGRWLATEKSGLVSVWDVDTGVKLFEDKIIVRSMNDIVFSGVAGDQLVVNTKGRLMHVLWQADELIAEACRRFSRNFTAKEWQRFFGQQDYENTCVSDNEL